MIQDKRFVSGRIKSIGFAVKGAYKLIKPILLWNSGWIKSAIFSTAVFKPSIAKTNPNAKICNIHSSLEILVLKLTI